MTKAERKKLAKAARELASEFAEGRGPQLSNHDFCGCAIGQVLYGGVRSRWLADNNHTAFDLDVATEFILTQATAHELGECFDGKLGGAVVFPLLWLADELESQP